MTEASLQKAICKYISLQYPNVLFNVDLSGVKLPIGLAKKVKRLRSGRGFPDMQILEPRGYYHGLFLELKKETPFKKDGTLKASQHLLEQRNMLELLRLRDYKAEFVWSFEIAKKLIDNYLR